MVNCLHCTSNTCLGVSSLNICHNCLLVLSKEATFYDSYFCSEWKLHDGTFYLDKLNSKEYLNLNWVYDISKNVFCFFDSGSHVFAIRFILGKYYNTSVFDKNSSKTIRGIINSNIIIYNSSLSDFETVIDTVLDD